MRIELIHPIVMYNHKYLHIKKASNFCYIFLVEIFNYRLCEMMLTPVHCSALD